jgi:diguanylate cyclase (GGDEF)-like protein
MSSQAGAKKVRDRFGAPREAATLRTAPARAFLVAIISVAFICAIGLRDGALWPSPEPTIAIVGLAFMMAVAGNYGTYQAVDGVAEYASLAMPIGFAMLLVLDWRGFAIGIALSEVFTFVSEATRRINPTMWYVRIFNVATQIVAGAAAETVLRMLRPLTSVDHGTWLSVTSALTLFLAALVWKILDNTQTCTLITLAVSRPLSSVRVPARVFISQFALFLIGIPFAYVWAHNIWVSLFALAPLGVAYRLLGLPELEYRARTDERTGLTNAGAFDRVVKSAIEASDNRGRRLVLLAIDIDHFKAVNDTFGHLVGDSVIKRFAEIITDVARRDDVAARTGGEEFALLMRDADRESAVAFAERLRQRVEAQAFDVDGIETPISITASIGVAMYPDDARVAHDLFAAADAALYRAKRGGRNLVRVAEGEPAAL